MLEANFFLAAAISVGDVPAYDAHALLQRAQIASPPLSTLKESVAKEFAATLDEFAKADDDEGWAEFNAQVRNLLLSLP